MPAFRSLHQQWVVEVVAAAAMCVCGVCGVCVWGGDIKRKTLAVFAHVDRQLQREMKECVGRGSSLHTPPHSYAKNSGNIFVQICLTRKKS